MSELLARQAAISEVLRAIASSPHDLQPIFQTILDSATRLCFADAGGTLRLIEKEGVRLVAQKLSPTVSKWYSPPTFVEHGTYIGRLVASRSPVHIPDLAALGQPDLATPVKAGIRTVLVLPMLRNDYVIGALAIWRERVEPFSDKQIELLTDFAAQAAIALEITRRERQIRELQMELAHANRVATIGQLSASIAHEVKQPIAVAVTGAQAARRWLNMQPANVAEIDDQLLRIEREGQRAGEVVDRLGALMKKTPAWKERLDINQAIREVSELARGEAVKNCVSIQMDLADHLLLIDCDRVQLQQVMLNLIVNGIQAMSDVADGQRDLLISTEATEDGVRVGVRDTGSGLRPESLPRLFEPFYTTKPDGMGMGLSICRSIIEAHGGRLWATGQPQGALFQFTIPPN